MRQVTLPQETLLDVIGVQQEIVEADLRLHDVMNVVTHAAARLTGSDAAVVELLEGEEMVYRAGAGAATGHVGLRLRAGGSLSGLCVRLNQTLRSDDTSEDQRVDREACRRVGARSMLVTPLRYRGEPLGALKVYSSRVAAFDDAAAETLELLVGIISASMHRAREHEGLQKRAHQDTLTGLANREQLNALLEARISDCQPFALAFVDLDGFKRVNDEHGHPVGDELLRTIARRITSLVRAGDMAARIGGDEFVLLLPGSDSPPIVDAILDRLCAGISEPVAIGGRTIHVSASAGVAIYPRDATTADELLRLADARMYSAKRH